MIKQGIHMLSCIFLAFVTMADADAFWRVIEEHGVNTLFSAPTAFRAMRQADPEGLTGFRARSHICDHSNKKPPCELAISRDIAN